MSDDIQVPVRHKRRARRRILLGLLTMVVLAATVGGVFVFKLANTFDTQTQKIVQAFPREAVRPVKATTGAASNAMNILVLGSDSRADSVDLAENGQPSDQRSDTMMWIHIPADRKNIYIMSIMRDTWVDIPGFGEAKINAAMAFGGVPLVVQTLEGMFNTRLDHVAVVDFQGFAAITDALGGVNVNVPIAFTSTHGNYTFPMGPQNMTGDQALGFVRERYAFADGDYQRVRDQQIFLKALMSQVMTPSTLANPLKVSQLIGSISPYLSVDGGLNAATVGGLAVSLAGVRAADVVSYTLPTLGTGTSSDGESIVLRDDASIAAIGAALANDSLGSYLANAGLGG